MGRRLEPTFADVAKEAGVSLTTVSRVLDSHGYLSQATEGGVARVIKASDYRPNQVVRALRGRQAYTIGLVIPTITLPFFGEIAIAVENAFTESGYRVLICNSLDHSDRKRDYLNLLIDNRADGTISGARNEDLEEYQSIHMPVVTINRSLSPRIPNVHCDNEAGDRLAIERLLTGDSRCPTLPASHSHGLNLCGRGYRITYGTAGIEPIVFEVPLYTAPADRPALMAQCLDGAVGMIGSVFATNDLAAAEILEWARQHDLLVSEQLRVIGFDRTVAARRALPTLTTIRQPIEDMAREAMRLLLGRIDAVNSTPLEGGANIPGIGKIVRFPVELPEDSMA